MSSAPEGYHDATVHLQVKPTFGKNWDDRLMVYVDVIESIQVVAMTQERPRKPKPGTITSKVTLRIPDKALMPFSPEAVITVPEGYYIVNPIEVVADDANEEQQ